MSSTPPSRVPSVAARLDRLHRQIERASGGGVLRELRALRVDAWLAGDAESLRRISAEAEFARQRTLWLRPYLRNQLESLRIVAAGNAREIDARRGPIQSAKPPRAPMRTRSKVLLGLAGTAVFVGLIVGCAVAITKSFEKAEAERPRITLPYEEDFSAGECSWLTGEDEDHETVCASGGYGLTVRQPNVIWFVSHKLSERVEALRIEVDATLMEAVGGAAEEGFGLTCITQSYPGGSFSLSTIRDGYRVGLEGGNAEIWRRETSRKEILLAERPVPLPRATRIGAECVGGGETTTVRLFLDGEEALAIDEDRASSFDEIGLYVLSDPEATGLVAVLFDNFVADTIDASQPELAPDNR